MLRDGSKMKKRNQYLGLATLGLVLAITGCTKHEKPNFVYAPDMAYSPAIKAQEEGQRMPVKGTIPRGYIPYQYAGMDAISAGRENKNPLRRTESVMARGQLMYNTYCIVCHGPQGDGDGYIVPKYPRPPSLQTEKIRNYADGSIYHIVTMGQNVMPSYATQIAPADRWAITHYIRALQRAKNPTPADVKAAEQE